MYCDICKKEIDNFRSLARHVKYEHGMFSKQYYDSFIKSVNEGICCFEDCYNQTNFNGLGKGYLRFCCSSHAQLSREVKNKRKRTCIRKYNCDTPLQNNEIRKKGTKTLLEKYGVKNISYCSRVQKTKSDKLKKNKAEKNHTYLSWLSAVKETWSKKSKSELEDIYQRRKATIINKYGTESYCIIRMLEKISRIYGVENISQIDWVIEKVRKTWESKTKAELEHIKNKREKTFMRKYGYSHIMHDKIRRKEILKKVKETCQRKGVWLKDDQLLDYQLYRRRVSHYTYFSEKEKFTSKELAKKARCGVDNGFQIDHMYSMKQGFLDGILPCIIGSKHNLRLISWEENDCKKHRCSIFKQELFELYEGDKGKILKSPS